MQASQEKQEKKKKPAEELPPELARYMEELKAKDLTDLTVLEQEMNGEIFLHKQSAILLRKRICYLMKAPANFQKRKAIDMYSAVVDFFLKTFKAKTKDTSPDSGKKWIYCLKVMFEAYELDFTKKGDEIGQQIAQKKDLDRFTRILILNLHDVFEKIIPSPTEPLSTNFNWLENLIFYFIKADTMKITRIYMIEFLISICIFFNGDHPHPIEEYYINSIDYDELDSLLTFEYNIYKKEINGKILLRWKKSYLSYRRQPNLEIKKPKKMTIEMLKLEHLEELEAEPQIEKPSNLSSESQNKEKGKKKQKSEARSSSLPSNKKLESQDQSLLNQHSKNSQNSGQPSLAAHNQQNQNNQNNLFTDPRFLFDLEINYENQELFIQAIDNLIWRAFEKLGDLDSNKIIYFGTKKYKIPKTKDFEISVEYDILEQYNNNIVQYKLRIQNNTSFNFTGVSIGLTSPPYLTTEVEIDKAQFSIQKQGNETVTILIKNLSYPVLPFNICFSDTPIKNIILPNTILTYVSKYPSQDSIDHQFTKFLTKKLSYMNPQLLTNNWRNFLNSLSTGNNQVFQGLFQLKLLKKLFPREDYSLIFQLKFHMTQTNEKKEIVIGVSEFIPDHEQDRFKHLKSKPYFNLPAIQSQLLQSFCCLFASQRFIEGLEPNELEQ